MITTSELDLLQLGHFFQKNRLIGKGVYGRVYYINDCYVVKKINPGADVSLKYEIETTVILSMYNISPKVVYHSKPNEKYRYYVMERLEYTVHHMLKKRIFTIEHLLKFQKVFDRINKTEYRHNDLHLNNIMWSTKLNDFRIIDWGIYYKTKKKKKPQSPRMIKELYFWMNNKFRYVSIFGYELKCMKIVL